MQIKISFKKTGFTLVETLVGVAVFLVIATATYQAYVSLFTLINLNQYKIIALNLANEQFEIIRNLPYSDVGIPSGIPNGKIPHVQTLVRSGITFIATTTIRNIDLPFDGLVGSSTKPDLSPADNKSIEVEIGCPNCKSFTPITLTTTVAPKNLETASTNGAILIKVFDSNGVLVSNANVHIVNSAISPNIVIDDVTDSDGFLQVVDAPPGTNTYKITVTKSGYSTDRTYTPDAGNPTPTKPDATVILQQLTPISFAIDKTSTLSISSVTPSCVAVPSMDFSLTGAKNIGTGISKYSQNLITDGSGNKTLSNMEWDSYTLVGTDSSYDVIGLNPLNAFALNPNTTQTVSIIVASKNSQTLLVTVKDSATRLPVTDAVVRVTEGSSYDVTKTTGRGFINQTDWSGGDGQATSTDDTKYFSSNNIDYSSVVGDIKLTKPFSTYNSDGYLESSTIDVGSASNFYNLTWSPINQPASTSVKLQFATATTSTPDIWNYIGPDGTSATYYTSPNSTLSSVHAGDRYARYKVYLSTDISTSTPNVSDISFTVTSSCTPPGQVVFTGLSSGSYHIEVTKSGYTMGEADPSLSTSWLEQEIILAP